MAKTRDKLFIEESVSEIDIDFTIKELGLKAD